MYFHTQDSGFAGCGAEGSCKAECLGSKARGGSLVCCNDAQRDGWFQPHIQNDGILAVTLK